MPQYVIDTLKPKNNNNFPVAEAVDVLYEEGSTVKDKIIAINALIVAAQQLIEGVQTDISELQSTKVDKVSGKGLSTNDFTNAYRDKIDDTYTKSETDTALAGKVDKVSGKGLSTNDFTKAYRDKIDDTYTKSETDTALAGKVDKVSGKGLSTNDFTNTYKNKVDNTYTKTETDSAIANKIAEVVAEAPESFDTLKEIADWIDTHADSASAMNSAIQANAANIEKKVDKVEGKELSTNDFTTAYKDKVDNTYTKTETDTALAGKVDKVSGKGLSTNDFTTAYKDKIDDTYTKSESDSITSAISTRVAENESDIAQLNTDIIAIETKRITSENIQELAFAGFFNSTNNNTTDFYLTADGKNFKLITRGSEIVQTDGDIIFVDGKFYYACRSYDTSKTMRILVSSDLVKWEENYFTFRTPTGGGVNHAYGEKWFKDTNGKIYLIYGQIVNNNPDKQVRPYIVECTDFETLTFGEAQELLPFDYRIDPFVIKKGDEYFLFCKKEKTDDINNYGEIEIWKSTSLFNWENVTYAIEALKSWKFEGPFVNYQNGKYFLYVDNWGATHFNGIEVCESTDLINWSEPIKAVSEKIMRHGFCRTITDPREMTIINNLQLQNWAKKPDDTIFYTHAQNENGTKVYTKLFEIKASGTIGFCAHFTITDVQCDQYDSDFTINVYHEGSLEDSPTPTVRLYEVNCRRNSLIDWTEIDVRYTISSSGVVTVMIRNDKMWATPCVSYSSISNNGADKQVKIYTENVFVTYDSSSFIKPTKQPRVGTKTYNMTLSSSAVSSGSCHYYIVNDSMMVINFTKVYVKEAIEKWVGKWLFTIGDKIVRQPVFCPVCLSQSGTSGMIKFSMNSDNNLIAEIYPTEQGVNANELIYGTCIVPFVYK